ncbi:amino acid adenylation domain-containing protein (plasmid) [Streptomyces sp. NBC_01450]|uniref:non-ribosomal peptide synthetase n=1 Tax=Streptomyces sp. NBC_01450 TaxID=2903871 RepID=UPI002E2ECC41|nr:non-ribosomal peptide synthetase [Streptomyces sp. NBC_01450]
MPHTKPDTRLPLTSAQRGIWTAQMMDPGNPRYHCASYLEIRGHVDAALLGRAVCTALEEAETLRVRFELLEGPDDGDAPVQVVTEGADGCLEFLDVSDAAEPRTTAVDWMRADLSRPVELTRGPLVRHVLIRESANSTLLYLRYHHILMDGLGQSIHLRRVAELYTAYAARTDPAASRTLSLRDLVDADLAYAESAAHRRDRAYWRERFRQCPEPVSLGQRTTAQARGLLRHTTDLPEADVARLRTVADELGVRTSAVLVAAVAAYQCRITSAPRTLLRIPLPARPFAAAVTTPAMWANEVPVPFEAPRTDTFAELVARTAGELGRTLRHQRLRGEELWREVLRDGPRGRPGGTTVNVVTFDSDLVFAGLPSIAHHVSSGPVDDLQLDFFCDPRTTRVRLNVDANPQCHDVGAPATHSRRLLALLRHALREPRLTLGGLTVMDDAERAHVLARSAPRVRDYDLGTPLSGLVEAQAARTPDAVAAEVSGASLTYGELVGRARRLAALLGERGVARGSVVGVCQERSLDLVVSLLGVLMSGAAYLPLDPELPAARLEFQVADAGVRTVLSCSRLADRVRGTEAEVVAVDEVLPLRPAAAPGALPDVRPTDIAYVIYTSGSTGAPKGVAVPHRGVVNRLLWMQEEYRLTAADRVLQKTPFTFDVSVWEFFWPLIAGARLHLAAPGAHRDPRALAAAMREHRVSTAHFVPPMLDLFLAEDTSAKLPDLRRVLCSGEALRPETVASFLARYGSGDEAPALFNLYGPTEASIDVTHWRCGTRDTLGPVPIGRAVANTSLYVLEPGGELLPHGAVGELYIGGVQVAAGYLGRPEQTAEKFVPDPFGPEGGVLYRTGDLAVLRADGVLEYRGRIDHQVKLHGFRIEPGEIESALLALDGVEAAVVTAPRLGDGGRRLLAHVVAPQVTPEELTQALAARLPAYMVPSAVVPLEALPLLPNGKVDRHSLPAPAADPLPSPGGEPGIADAVEQLVHNAFAEALDVAGVDPDVSFFALGGDSLTSIRMRTRLERCGRTFTLQDLYDAPTVRALAPHTRPHTPGRAHPGPFSLLSDADRALLPPGLDDAYPLSSMQSGMVFHAAYEEASSVYRVVTSIRIQLPCDAAVLRAALDGTVRRHPTLRSSVHLTGYSEPLQLVHRDARVPLDVDESLRGANPEEQDRRLRAWAGSAKQHDFDLTKAPLLACTAHPLDDGAFQLSVVEHHVALDGWSDAAMLDEIVERYRAALGGEDLWLPEVRSTFRDFVAAEREAVADEEHRAFWAQELAGVEAAPLPVREARRTARARPRRFDVSLDGATGARIIAAARAAALPPKSLLAAAHAVVLGSVTPAAEILTGVVTHGRMEEDGGDQAIGVFLNTLPLRLPAARGASWIQLAGQVHAHERRTAAHRRYPYAQILREHQGLSLDSYVNFMDFHQQWGAGHLVHSGFGVAETNYPLAANFLVDPAGGRLALWLDCDLSVLEEEFCGRLAGYYQRALTALAADVHAPPPDDLRGAAELSCQRAWNDTTVPYDDQATVDRLISRRIEASPGAVALHDGSEPLGYGELDARANRLARQLRSLGVGRGSRVGVSVRRSAALVVSLLAVVRSGAAYVPMDPDFPAERLRHIAEDAVLDCLVVGPGGPEGLPARAVVRLAEDADAIAAHCAEPLEEVAGPNDPVYVIYTSGSTGRPKGTVVLHRNVVNFFVGMDRAVGLSADDVVLALTSVSFDISVLELLWPLSRGASVVVGGERMIERLTPADGEGCLTDLVARHGVTLLQATPSFLAAVAAQPQALKCLRPLRALLVGGEVFPSGLARRLLAALPSVRVCNMYGPTETTIWSTVHELDRDRDPHAAALPIGRPLANTTVHIVADDGRHVPIGVAGELWIGGDGVAAGYHEQAELTAQRFVAGPGGRVYRTGDRVRRRADGALEFLGRVDRQVKILGHRIEPDEVESVLSRHPEVAAVAVVAAERFDGTAELVSYVAPVSPGASDTQTLSHLERWRDVWEGAYVPDDGVAGDFDGWLSSYTQRPLPEAEMDEWLARTLERIRATGPRRVVDVGVGVGLYLRELAPGAASYLGIDLSATALSRAAAQVGAGGRLPDHITLRQGDATLLAKLPDGSADLVLFNSVVQYFPSSGYLRRVLTDALRVAGPAGAVFIGDVRDLALLPAFHADTQVRRSPALSPAREVAAAAARALAEERELCLSTGFFTEFAAATGTGVRIELKRGHSTNELTRFRWDVTLYGPHHAQRPGPGAEGVELAWSQIGDEAKLAELLTGTGPDRALTVTGLPDRRLLRPLTALTALGGGAGGDLTAWDVERSLWEANADATVHPEDIASLAAAHGRVVRLCPPPPDRVGEFDAVFEPASAVSVPSEHREHPAP